METDLFGNNPPRTVWDSPPPPRAVLWDLDGTLVDTEPAWMASEQTLAASHGADWTMDDALAVVGLDLRDTAEYIRRRMNVSHLSVDFIIQELGTNVSRSLEDGIAWRPGAVDLFSAIADRGIPQGLVTMSYEFIARPIISALDFEVVVTGDAVTLGKPHPEPYLRAIEQLDLDGNECLAIEDSPTGTASANAAGCVVLAVPHMVDIVDAPRRHRIDSLLNITVDDLSRLF